MAILQGEDKEDLIGGYPSNVKRWKEKFFFISEDGWEFPEGAGREVGALTILRSWGIPRKERPDAFTSLGNMGESHHFRDNLVECIGTIRYLGTGCQSSSSPFLSSSSSSGAMAESWLPSELKSDVAQSKGGNSVTRPTLAKGMVIGEKRPREDLISQPSKKGPSASILSNSSVVKKLLRGVNPPADKEKMEKLTLDQKATRLFHVIGQTLVLGSSLVVKSREAGEEASLHQGRVASLEIEDADSKYFGKGFDFCKRQLRRHHPNLAIDLEGMGLDQNLLAKEDEAKEEKEKEDGGKDMGDVNPFLSNSFFLMVAYNP
ncbi:hypothetical protein Acr_10g0010330 [Actinidia rufa]|uniref:Uncharacterized protein n=1 Tax=Actinidia rufa TaxID=165716 RepID=A0A7J0FAB6_9ERIC|nr:hypothetical protein Acr_10g0010330 [Actinidia rufa]